MNSVSTILIISGLITVVITVILILPWYTKQLGKFFCKGFLECFHETLDIKLDKMYYEFQQSKKENLT